VPISPLKPPDELLICRVIVTPSERPADEPIAETTQAVSRRIEHGDELLSRFSVKRDFIDRSAIHISGSFNGTAPGAGGNTGAVH
jgi:hypothetical protein